MLKITRQHLFNSLKCWPLNIPFDPSPSGQGAHHFSLCHIWQLAAWAWAWAGVGVAGRWARRHAAPAVVGRFIRDLAFFGDSERSGFGLHDDDGRRRRRNRAPPLKPPGSSNRKSPNFYRQIFFFKKKFGAKIFLAILNKQTMEEGEGELEDGTLDKGARRQG